MTFFDDEERIVEHLRNIELSKIKFVNFSYGLLKFFISLYLKPFNKKWNNNTLNRPDYLNHSKRYMMEIMRFDDKIAFQYQIFSIKEDLILLFIKNKEKVKCL